MRVPRGGRLLSGSGASGDGRSPIPDLLSIPACGRRPPPTGCGCGGVRAWGPVTNPTARALASWLCALWGRHEGARGGASCLGVGRPGTGALPGPDLSSVPACGRGPLPTGCGCGGCGRDDRHQPHSARSCMLWGRHEVAQGWRLLPGFGASEDGRSPTLDLSSVRACGRGPLPTGCGWGGCGLGDPSSTPQRALMRAGFACCGGGMRVPGGGASCLGVGRPEMGALPPPTSRPFGCEAGSTTAWLLVPGVRAWGPLTNPTARAPASWLCALWGRHEGARGGRLLPACGTSGDGLSPTPDLSSVRACVLGPLPTGCGCGGCGRGNPSPTPQRALLRAGFGWKATEATSRPLWSRAQMTAGDVDLIQAGPVDAAKPPGVTTRPPPVAAFGATPCPHVAAGRRSGMNG